MQFISFFILLKNIEKAGLPQAFYCYTRQHAWVCKQDTFSSKPTNHQYYKINV